jgi:hypothetical protein
VARALHPDPQGGEIATAKTADGPPKPRFVASVRTTRAQRLVDSHIKDVPSFSRTARACLLQFARPMPVTSFDAGVEWTTIPGSATGAVAVYDAVAIAS